MQKPLFWHVHPQSQVFLPLRLTTFIVQVKQHSRTKQNTNTKTICKAEEKSTAFAASIEYEKEATAYQGCYFGNTKNNVT